MKCSRLLSTALFCALLLLPAGQLLAQDAGGGDAAAADDGGGGGVDKKELDPCPLNSGMLPELLCIGGGADGLVDIIFEFVPIVIDIFVAMLIIMLLVYSVSLIVGSTDENAITETRKAFIYAIVASFIVFFKEDIYDFIKIGEPDGGAGAGGGEGALISTAALVPGFESVLKYMQYAAAAIAMAFVTVRGIQLMAAGGDEGRVTSSRKLLINAVIGVGIVILAGAIVRASLPGGFSVLSDETEGIALYIMLILGALITASIVIGGAMLILSYDEGLQERAKKSILASVIVLVALVLLGALIAFIAF